MFGSKFIDSFVKLGRPLPDLVTEPSTLLTVSKKSKLLLKEGGGI